MPRYCRVIATGRIIEYQSHAPAGLLTQNAVNAGLSSADVEEIETTEAEWNTVLYPGLLAADRVTTEHAGELRQSLGSIFVGTARQKRARWVDVIEQYPAKED